MLAPDARRVRALALGALILLPLVSASPVAPGTTDLIVTLREGASFETTGVLPLSVFPGFVLFDASPADAARLAADPRVERVDRAKPLAFDAAARLPTHAFTGLTRADATGLDGSGVMLAVVDSGIDATHPDLAGRVLRNVKLVEGAFVPTLGDADGHGTHVAGIVASSGAGSQGRWSGIAPGADLVGLDISGRFTTASAVLAYDWIHARRGELDIDVVVNAWGRVDDEPFDVRDPVMRAIDRVVADGTVVVFSASNHGPDSASLSAEAMHPRVITVGATDAAGLVMHYSSRGPVASDTPWTKPDVVAPGDGVVAPRSLQTVAREGDPDAFYTTYSGTSQAAPHVAGIVALMLQARPDLEPADVAHALRASAIDLGPAGPDDASGFGLVDAEDALRVANGLSPSRANVLVTGGVERYHDEAPIAPTARRGVLELISRPEVVWETPFPVKPGARMLRVEANAEGARSVEIDLSKDGAPVAGTEVADPEPGIWTLRVRATLPIATSVAATIETDLPPNPARALAFDGRPSGGPAPASDASFDLDRFDGALVAAGLAAAFASIAALAWPRRKHPNAPPVAEAPGEK